MKKITKLQAQRLFKHYNLNPKAVLFDEWLIGLNIELEHGKKFGALTNVTNDNLHMTAKIALSHLKEDPKYYYYLHKQEEKRDQYWKTHKKPKIFL